LIPSKVQFNLKVWNGDHLIATYLFSNVLVANKIPEKKEMVYEESIGVVTKHSIENFLPLYSPGDLQHFNDRVDVINQYYKDAKRIVESINLLRSINPNDIDHFSIEQQKFSDANKTTDEIDNKKYGTKLFLEQ